MSRKELSIGLFGFGCVGYGLYEVLQKTPALKATITRVCVKDKNKIRPIASNYFTFDKNDILLDKNINTVVELIDDADAALEIVRTAMQNGKSVVTANKKMLAENFEELFHLQKKYNVSLLYEASCCASIPIIRNLEEYYDNDLLDSIEGIVNGSTNYILTKLTQQSVSFEDALKDAQQKGFAETNPLLDTQGFDAKFKLLILIAHAFGVVLKPNDIVNIGIDKLNELELNYAREKGYKIKLIAFAQKSPTGEIVSFVMPKFVDKTDKLFLVDDVFNGVKTKSYFSDTQFFVGKGAGAYPTASAVLSDISALTYDYKYEYKKINKKENFQNDAAVFLRIFLRHRTSSTAILKNYFSDIEESYSNKESGFIIGRLSFESLKKLVKLTNIDYSVVLFDVIKENLN